MSALKGVELWCVHPQELVSRFEGLDERAANAMRAIDRIIFVPPKLQKHAYEDRPLPFGPEQTISAPHMHATALSVLAPVLTEGARVLDVGVGSGYMLSVMAEMVGESGRCAGIDIVPSIVELARENIRRQGTGLAARALEQKRLFLGAVDGWGGLELEAPFDAIHVGAAATSIPEKLVEQLAAGGRMVIPVGPIHGVQELLEVRRDAKTMKVCADLRWCLQRLVAKSRCKQSLQTLVADSRCKHSLQFANIRIRMTLSGLLTLSGLFQLVVEQALSVPLLAWCSAQVSTEVLNMVVRYVPMLSSNSNHHHQNNPHLEL